MTSKTICMSTIMLIGLFAFGGTSVDDETTPYSETQPTPSNPNQQPPVSSFQNLPDEASFGRGNSHKHPFSSEAGTGLSSSPEASGQGVLNERTTPPDGHINDLKSTTSIGERLPENESLTSGASAEMTHAVEFANTPESRMVSMNSNANIQISSQMSLSTPVNQLPQNTSNDTVVFTEPPMQTPVPHSIVTDLQFSPEAGNSTPYLSNQTPNASQNGLETDETTGAEVNTFQPEVIGVNNSIKEIGNSTPSLFNQTLIWSETDHEAGGIATTGVNTAEPESIGVNNSIQGINSTELTPKNEEGSTQTMKTNETEGTNETAGSNGNGPKQGRAKYTCVCKGPQNCQDGKCRDDFCSRIEIDVPNLPRSIGPINIQSLFGNDTQSVVYKGCASADSLPRNVVAQKIYKNMPYSVVIQGQSIEVDSSQRFCTGDECNGSYLAKISILLLILSSVLSVVII